MLLFRGAQMLTSVNRVRESVRMASVSTLRGLFAATATPATSWHRLKTNAKVTMMILRRIFYEKCYKCL